MPLSLSYVLSWHIVPVTTDRADVNILVYYSVSYICVFSAELILSETCHRMMDRPLVQEVVDLI